MTLKGQKGVVAVHSLPVICDADQFASPCPNLHANSGRTGVERVLQKLLHYRRWAVYYFAGGDLIRHLVRKNADAPHTGKGNRNGRQGHGSQNQPLSLPANRP